MSYTILTTIRSNGDDRVFAQVMGGGEDLLALGKEHIEALQLELTRRECDGSIVLKPTEKHPLEEVFASVFKQQPTDSDIRERLTSPDSIDKCFNRTLDVLKPRSGELRRAIAWASVRLVRSGAFNGVQEVLQAAVEQATKGKGQRHGGDRTPFLEQPWVRLYKTHGLGFLLGQADKKYNEALGKGNQEDQVREILGAIVYLGMALLVLEGKVK